MSLHPEVEKEIEAGRKRVIAPEHIGMELIERLETPEEFASRIALRQQELEREECAKVCMRRIDARWSENSVVESDTNAAYYPKSVAWMETADEEAEDCATAIRRRGKP